MIRGGRAAGESRVNNPQLKTAYDQRTIDSLARALRSLGHEADAAPKPLSEREVVSRCIEIGATIIIEVNRLRPLDRELPAGVRHIAWYQDVFPETFDEIRDRIQDNDVVYTLGDAESIGLTFPLPCRERHLWRHRAQQILDDLAD